MPKLCRHLVSLLPLFQSIYRTFSCRPVYLAKFLKNLYCNSQKIFISRKPVYFLLDLAPHADLFKFGWIVYWAARKRCTSNNKQLSIGFFCYLDTRGEIRALIVGEGRGVFIYSCSARLISLKSVAFKVQLTI